MGSQTNRQQPVKLLYSRAGLGIRCAECIIPNLCGAKGADVKDFLYLIGQTCNLFIEQEESWVELFFESLN